ncbi:MAG: AMP-binding protein, partial [Pseudonocardia sediminis]
MTSAQTPGAGTPLVPSYASGVSDTPLLGDTIGDNFDRTVATYPDVDALVEVSTGRRWTYVQLREDVDKVACGLLQAGLQVGDRVGIWAPNMAEWTLVQYATAKIGVVLVNINPSYRTHELEFVLNQAGISVLVAAREFKTSDYAGMIEQVRPNCPELRKVVIIGSPEWDEVAAGGDAGDRVRLAEIQAGLSTDDPINIQYTSGTTGFPKGATLSHHNILNNGYFLGRILGYTPDDRVCIPVPFYHCFGMVMGNLGCTTNGATMVIPAQGFDP